jgi:DNA-binding CsgD family transcriptional regulator
MITTANNQTPSSLGILPAMSVLQRSRPVRPNDLPLIEQIPGIMALARDEDLRIFWHTQSLSHSLVGEDTPQQLLGTSLADVLTPSAAMEREPLHREVMLTGKANSHFRLCNDTRLLCTIIPLDRDAFGYHGTFAIITESANSVGVENDDKIPVLTAPNLYELSVLSSRELEVLHHIAKGLSTNAIAAFLSRSSKTVEKQVNSIHSKLKTSSRAELVRFATERGIQSFSDEDWSAIVEGAKTLRRERRERKARAAS